MKITNNEILILQDVTGNGSLALKHLHKQIKEELDVQTLDSIIQLGKKLVDIAQAIHKTHMPFTAYKER